MDTKKVIVSAVKTVLVTSAVGLCVSCNEKPIPLVYDVENTGAEYALPLMPTVADLPVIHDLPDALEGVNDFSDWSRRRSEIAAMIQHYGIGQKPAVNKDEQVKARMSADTLIVDVTVNGETLTLSSVISYPKEGEAPYPLMIGTSGISLPREMFDVRPIATMVYRESQVNSYSQFFRRDGKTRGDYEFDRLYPELKENGAYSEWAWGYGFHISVVPFAVVAPCVRC